VSSLDARLGALRGPTRPLPYNARTLAALTANPACDRRAVLDAAGIDKAALAGHLEVPQSQPKSLLALRHGLAFEHRVLDRDRAELIRLLRETLNLDVAEVAYEDVNSVATYEDTSPLPLRHARTHSLIMSAVGEQAPPRTLLNHPVLRLPMAGHEVYLEPDVLAFKHDNTFHVVEIKSFPVLYGQAEPASVTAALTQAAAYILALRHLLDEAPPKSAAPSDNVTAATVSDDVVLIHPLNFTPHPTATLQSARKQVRALSFHIDRLRRLPELLEEIPPDTTLDPVPGPDGKPTRSPRELAAELAHLTPHYTTRCRHHCDLAVHCRNEARTRNHTAALGTEVREDIAGISTTTTALELADGHLHPSTAQKDIARTLRHTQRLINELEEGAG
jgi:hypothetical protein